MLAADKGWASTNAIPQPVGVADAAGESDRAAAKANNGGTTMGAIDPARVATHSFDWGVIKMDGEPRPDARSEDHVRRGRAAARTRPRPRQPSLFGGNPLCPVRGRRADG